MVTLLQLNRHLDDVHKEIEVREQDEVKDWFQAQMLKAKKFQPLAVLNQKLKGLDVFESNNDSSVGSGRGSGSATPTMRTGSADGGRKFGCESAPVSDDDDEGGGNSGGSR